MLLTSTYLGYPINTLSVGRKTNTHTNTLQQSRSTTTQEEKVEEEEEDHVWILVGGGGGPSKSGIKNQLSMFQVSTLPTTTTTATATPLWTLNSVDVVDFGNTEDAVWSVAMNSKCSDVLAGVNPSNDASQVWSGRHFKFIHKKLQYTNSINTVVNTTLDYQCACTFSPNSLYFATGSDLGQFFVVSLDSFQPFPWSGKSLNSKIYSISFTPDSLWVGVTCSNKVVGYDVNSGKKRVELEPPPDHTFRCSQFHTNSILYVAMNRTKKKRASYLAIWDLSQPSTQPTCVTWVAHCPIVSMTVRTEFTAVGLVDCSIHVFRNHRERLFQWSEAHTLPTTGLSWMFLSSSPTQVVVQPPLSPSHVALCSVSSDGFLKVWSLDTTVATRGWWWLSSSSSWSLFTHALWGSLGVLV
ncbi:hypothetical protein HMI56_003732, partial [Coelomomyces lativittatus]